MLVQDLMSAPAVTVSPPLPLPDAAHLMGSRGIRRLPVVEGGRLVGIVTERDVREAQPGHPGAGPGGSFSSWKVVAPPAAAQVGDVMRRSVVTTAPGAPAQSAARALLCHRVGALPVLDAAGHVVGVVTVADVLRGYVAPLPCPTAEVHV